MNEWHMILMNWNAPNEIRMNDMNEWMAWIASWMNAHEWIEWHEWIDCINERMHEWMIEWMNEWMNECMHLTCINEFRYDWLKWTIWTNERANELFGTNEWMNCYGFYGFDGWMDGWMNGRHDMNLEWMNEWMNEWMALEWYEWMNEWGESNECNDLNESNATSHEWHDANRMTLNARRNRIECSEFVNEWMSVGMNERMIEANADDINEWGRMKLQWMRWMNRMASVESGGAATANECKWMKMNEWMNVNEWLRWMNGINERNRELKMDEWMQMNEWMNVNEWMNQSINYWNDHLKQL